MNRLIAKYAMLLSAFYVVGLVLAKVVTSIDLSENLFYNTVFKQNLPLLFNLILNLITAYIIEKDIKKLNVQTKYVTLATIIYRPLGAFAFLLFLFFQDKKMDGITEEGFASAQHKI